jgi:hypothetical protein
VAQLEQLWLRNIGYPDARYQDTRLNFTNEDAAPEHATVHLRNGGGKSSLIALYFAMLLPGSKNFIGKKANRNLKDYVPKGTTGLILSQWRLDDARNDLFGGHAVRRVLGVLHEHLPTGNFVSTYFSVKVRGDVQGATLETLPVSLRTGGNERLFTSRELREALDAINDTASGEPPVKHFSSQWLWQEHLSNDLGFDERLLRLQASMNLREASADEQFKFKSDKDLLDFLFRHTLPRSTVQSLNDTLNQKRHALLTLATQSQPTLEYAQETIEEFEGLAEVKVARQALQQASSGTIASFHQLERRTNDSISSLGREREEKEEQRRTLGEQLQLLEAEIGLATWLRTAGQVEEQRLLLARAEADLTKAREREVSATRVRDGWKVAAPLARAQAAQRDITELRKQLESLVDSEVARDAAREREVAALELGEALLVERDRLERGVEQLQIKSSASDEAVDDCQADLGRLQREEGTVEQALNAAEATITHVEGVKKRLIADGVLEDGVSPAVTGQRLDRELEEQTQEALALKADAETADEELERLREAKGAAEKREWEAAQAKKLADRDYARAVNELAKIQSIDVVRELVGDDWDHDSQVDTLGTLLADSLKRLNSQVIDLRLEESVTKRRYEDLLDSRLASPPASVRKALRVLREGDIQAARSAGHHLAERTSEQDPESARTWVRRAPLVANAVVVPSDQLDKAKEFLDGAQEQFDTPVLLATPADLDEPTEFRGTLFGPGALERFHYKAAEDATERIKRNFDTLTESLHVIGGQHDEYQSAANDYSTFRGTYPAGAIRALEREQSKARAGHNSAVTARELAEEQVQDQQAKLADLRKRHADAAEVRQRTENRLERLREFEAQQAPMLAKAIEEKRTAAIRKLELPDEITKAIEALKSARAEVARRQENLKQERQRLRDTGRELEQLREEYELDPLSPRHGDVAHLRQRHQSAVETHLGKITDGRLRGRLERAQSDHEAAENEAKQSVRTAGVEEAQQLLQALGSLESPRVAAKLDEAQEALDAAKNEERTAIGRHQEAQQQWRNAMNTLEALPQPTGADNPTFDTSEAAQAYVKHQQVRIEVAQQTRAEVSPQLESVKARLTDLQSESKDLDNFRDRLGDLKFHHRSLFERTSSDARSTVSLADRDYALATIRAALAKAREEEEGLGKQRESICNSLRRILKDPRYQHIQVKSRDNLYQHSNEDLEERSTDYLHAQQQLATTTRAHIDSTQGAARQVVEALSTLVTSGFGILRTINEAARLPGGDGRAIRLIAIDHAKQPEHETMKVTLERLLNSILSNNKLSNDVMEVALQAMHTCLEGVSIRIQHPDPTIKRTLSVEQLVSKSGGESLTAVLIIFFALVRSSFRGKEGVPPTTTLWLDNPIGSSSTPRFLHLQHQFAERMGVQLVYSTAVSDHQALAVLPNIIWLRNETKGAETDYRYIVEDHDSPSIQAVRMLRLKANNPQEAA